jgi:hypothetical protein
VPPKKKKKEYIIPFPLAFKVWLRYLLIIFRKLTCM